MVEWKDYFGWTYTGVNTSLASSGGSDCAAYLTDERKMAEAIIFCTMSLVEICISWRGINLPKDVVKPVENSSRLILLLLLSFTFGIEVGFKLATRQFIWLLNPCHVITATQLYLLAFPPSKLITIIFRLHLYYLVGPIFALLVPVTSSRKHVFEREIYFIQHILIFITPHFLLKSKGMYTQEKTLDYNWPLMALGLVFLYHFTILQFLGNVTQVNLNNILCPASADPFAGPWYRAAAVFHQTPLIVLMGKVYPIISAWISEGSWSIRRDSSGNFRNNNNGIFTDKHYMGNGEKCLDLKEE